MYCNPLTAEMPDLTIQQIADDTALRAVDKAHATRTIDGLHLPIYCPKSAAVSPIDQTMYRKLWQVQRSGEGWLLIPATAFAGGHGSLSLDRHELAQHTLFSGDSYRYAGETLDGPELIGRLADEPKVQQPQRIELHLPYMCRGRVLGRSVD